MTARGDQFARLVRTLVRKLVRTKTTHLHAHFSRTNARCENNPMNGFCSPQKGLCWRCENQPHGRLGKHPMQAAIEGDVWVRWTARSRQGAGAILGRGTTPDSKPEHAKETLRRHGKVTVRPGGRARSLEQAAEGNRAFPHPEIFPLLTEPLTMTLTGRGEGWNLEPMQADTAPVLLFSSPQNRHSEKSPATGADKTDRSLLFYR